MRPPKLNVVFLSMALLHDLRIMGAYEVRNAERNATVNA